MWHALAIMNDLVSATDSYHHYCSTYTYIYDAQMMASAMVLPKLDLWRLYYDKCKKVRASTKKAVHRPAHEPDTEL